MSKVTASSVLCQYNRLERMTTNNFLEIALLSQAVPQR